MSNHDNHRRGEQKRAEHGPRWEGRETDRHSARARARWKKIKHRTFRRTGAVTQSFWPVKKGRLAPLPDDRPDDE